MNNTGGFSFTSAPLPGSEAAMKGAMDDILSAQARNDIRRRDNAAEAEQQRKDDEYFQQLDNEDAMIAVNAASERLRASQLKKQQDQEAARQEAERAAGDQSMFPVSQSVANVRQAEYGTSGLGSAALPFAAQQQQEQIMQAQQQTEQGQMIQTARARGYLPEQIIQFFDGRSPSNLPELNQALATMDTAVAQYAQTHGMQLPRGDGSQADAQTIQNIVVNVLREKEREGGMDEELGGGTRRRTRRGGKRRRTRGRGKKRRSRRGGQPMCWCCHGQGQLPDPTKPGTTILCGCCGGNGIEKADKGRLSGCCNRTQMTQQPYKGQSMLGGKRSRRGGKRRRTRGGKRRRTRGKR